MPDRIFGTDVQLAEHFTSTDLTGIEYADGHYVGLFCKHCKCSWGVKIGDMGEIPAGARNPLVAHLHAHQGNGVKHRPILFKLPPAP